MDIKHLIRHLQEAKNDLFKSIKNDIERTAAS